MRIHSGIVLAVLLGAVGCGKSKVDQCNAFIDRANAAQGAVTSLNFGDDAKKLEAAATKIEGEAKGVKGVELKDEKLVKLRDDYAANLDKLASTVRDLAKLGGEKDPENAEEQAKKLEADADKIEKNESKLVDEINAYCSGS